MLAGGDYYCFVKGRMDGVQRTITLITAVCSNKATLIEGAGGKYFLCMPSAPVDKDDGV